jgi:hypothetical protein
MTITCGLGASTPVQPASQPANDSIITPAQCLDLEEYRGLNVAVVALGFSSAGALQDVFWRSAEDRLRVRARTREHPVKLASVGPRARHLLAVDVPAAASRRAQLLKLAVEGLPVSAHAGIADRAFWGEFRSYLMQTVTP